MRWPGRGDPTEGATLRVVFDTNLVVSALVFGGRLTWLRTAWERGAVTPLVCRETAAELLRVLAYPKFRLDRERRDDLLGDYLPYAEAVILPARVPELPIDCRDRDDAVFIRLAIEARADLLVSGDRDVIVLRNSCPVPIATANELKVRLEEQSC